MLQILVLSSGESAKSKLPSSRALSFMLRSSRSLRVVCGLHSDEDGAWAQSTSTRTVQEARRKHCWRRISLLVVEGSWDGGGPEL
jgi:hypothetical protein